MIINNKNLFDRFLELGVIDEAKLKSAFETAESQGKNLADLLYEMDLITDQQISQTIGDMYSIPYVNLEEQEITDDCLNTISEIFSRKQNIIAFKKDKTGLFLATSNPLNKTALDFIAKKTGLPLKIYFTTERNIKNFWKNREAKSGSNFKTEIERLISDSEKINSVDTPIISLTNLILEYSEKNHASDIHIEPGDNQSIIRFRIDSILHDIAIIPLKIHPQLISRIKVMSKLKIDEQQSAQDGKFQFKVGDNKIDVRVSITPTINGEKAVLRLLSSSSRQFSLTTLGLNEIDLNKIISAHKKPFGMILATGPTGSGKTTTLYAILKLINTREVNIMTIEDPVEYEIEGINQIQVNPLTNLTFVQGLRSIVRQDPNIILVGEIRDQETAQIASQAALTGHLVLSTLHTNDAATTIPRLTEMGIEPFIIASSINCIIAQRLVRQICQKCRFSKEITKKDLSKLNLETKVLTELFGDNEKIRIYEGKGCNICHQTGYLGRIGIFEVMTLDQNLKEAIISKQPADVINNLAVKSGMQSMLSDGIKKVLSGITTIEEILRATKI